MGFLGTAKNMLVSNTLFRMGGAAVLLSNKYMDGFRAKYSLYTTVRVHKVTVTYNYLFILF
jgi:3-ketoacyl-CoA synthase